MLMTTALSAAGPVAALGPDFLDPQHLIDSFGTWVLLGIMAIVFVGNGVAALQEAGAMKATLVDFVTLQVLGIHPTAEGLLLQCLTAAIVVGGVMISRRKALAASPAQ